MGDQGYFIRRWSQKPALKNIGNYKFRRAVNKFMEGRESDDYLEDWIYCDPFLRFLRTVGPQNAASLKSVCFDGKMMEHGSKDPLVCESEYRGRCLRYYLKLYGPFVQRHCPGITKLILRLENRGSEAMTPKKIEQDLVMILRSEIAYFPSLRGLEVKGWEGDLWVADAELMKRIQEKEAVAKRLI
jgi:hypothetical protein